MWLSPGDLEVRIMGAEEVVKYGDPVLNERAKEVTEFNDEIKQLIAHMYDVMVAAEGVGLAANQVGKSIRLFVYDVGEGPHAFINPVILKKSGSQIASEGCLSVPGLHGDVDRANIAVVEGLNENGEKVRITGKGLLARAFQHEIDHLDGILFIDRADPDTLEIDVVDDVEDEE